MKLHRVSHPCPKCGYGYHARGGKYVCCGTSVAKESEIKVKIHKRRRTESARLAESFAAQRTADNLVEGPDSDAQQLRLFK